MKIRRSTAAAALGLAVVLPAAANGLSGQSSHQRATQPVHQISAPANIEGGRNAARPYAAPVGHAVPMTPTQQAVQRQAAVRATVSPTMTNARSTAYSTNWSGLLTSGSFTGIAGQWTVPSIQVTSANHYGCTWIGLDGWGRSSLIQTGTEEDSYNGQARYYAWVETLPASQQVITYSNGQAAPVAPGDSMWSYIYKTGTNTWAVYLQDQTRGWSLSTSRTYSTPGGTVEWVHEATQVGGVVSAPPAFSPVNFNTLEVKEGSTWYYTNMDARSKVFLVRSGHTYASPSTPTATSPQRFSVTSS